jgi:O-antigen/teichoic acid export membrane protein
MMVGAAAIAAAKAFVFAKILPKDGYGYYQLALTTSTYLAVFFSLGMTDGFLREGALAWGQNRLRAIRVMRTRALAFALSSSLLFSALLSPVVYYLDLVPSYKLALFLAMLLGASVLEFNIAATYLRVTERLNGYAAYLLVRNVSVVLLGSYAALRYSFVQLLMAEGAISILSVIVMLLVELPARGRKDIGPTDYEDLPSVRHSLRQLCRVGLPISGNYLVRSLTLNIDRWFVAFTLGAFAMGEYSFAMISLSVALSLVNIMMLALGPRWIALYGQTEDICLVHRSVTKMVLLGFGLALIGYLPVFLLLPWILARVFPQYANTFWLIVVIYSGVIFTVLNFYEWVYIAIGRTVELIYFAVGSLLLVGTLCVIGAATRANPMYYAVVFGVGRLFTFVLTAWRAYAIVSRANVNASTASR